MFRLISLIALAGTVAVCILHYAAFHAKRWRPGKSTASMYRFSVWERLVHALGLLGFLTLAETGFWAVVVRRAPLDGWLWMVHAAAGGIFAAAMVLMTLLWAMDCRFARSDWRWVRNFGGYLGRGENLPAGRFNAGQKAFLWCGALLGLATLASGLALMVPIFGPAFQESICQVHRYSSLLFVMSVVVHLYVATLANPGTTRSMVVGTVSTEWAEHHHPLWLEDTGGTDGGGSRE
jgi:formate dehydrogenase subunit gamma